ncbi:NAD(P)-dependent oxidoreductase [Rhodococcus sp. IEGM 1381]|nr:NAD(P)-dependent oxidoreductase [Rhodococcus sp. IEGM 1381]MDI9894486.1 NAD(P)-dependent oxidoreductase [Rhodococcus sp. IEGM 1381]
MTVTLAITGGSGFIGSAVARILLQRSDIRVIWIVHSHPPPVTKSTDQLVGGDLCTPDTLHGMFAGADAVLHLGHRITGSPDQLAAVNTAGAAAVAAEAHSAGAHLVAVSTAAVHGQGPWDGIDIHDLPEAPGSPTSATRAEGDGIILDRGGTVIRPHIVIGEGDQWVVPRAAKLVSEFGWEVLGSAVHSIIEVDELARRLIVAAVDAPTPPGVWLAAERRPRRLDWEIDEYFRRQDSESVVNKKCRSRSIDQALQDDPRLAHDLRFIGNDHHLTCVCSCAPSIFTTDPPHRVH